MHENFERVGGGAGVAGNAAQAAAQAAAGLSGRTSDGISGVRRPARFAF